MKSYDELKAEMSDPQHVPKPFLHSSKTRDFLLTLPQPLVVFGSGCLVASTAIYGWMDTGAMVSLILLMRIPALLLLELIFPKRQDWLLTWRDLAIDMFWVLSVLLIWVPLFDNYYDTPISDAFVWLREASAFPITLQAESMTGLVGVAVVAMIVKEFIYYWIHRLQHRYMLMWRMHATHHHITKMGAARADRTHPLEFLLLNIGSVIVLSFMQASSEVVAVYIVMVLVNAYMAHANLPLRSGVFGLLFTTAEWHHSHHSLDRKESERNFGCTIILWDRVFGTFNGSPTVARVGNGTGKSLSLYTQFTMPFRSDKTLREL